MLICRLRELVERKAIEQKRRKYSVREIAAGAGVAPSVVQGLLSDSFINISRKTIDRISNYLDCRPEDWLVWEPARSCDAEGGD